MRSQTTTWISDKLSKLFKDIVDRGLEDEAFRLLKILPPPLEGMLEGGIPSALEDERGYVSLALSQSPQSHP